NRRAGPSCRHRRIGGLGRPWRSQRPPLRASDDHWLPGGDLASGLVLADERLELVRHTWNRLGDELEASGAPARHDVLGPPLRVGLREVLARVAAAALGTHERAPGDRFAHSDEVLEVEREVPTGVVD